MKKSISQWSFPAGLTMDECMAWAKDAGFEGIEIALEEDTDGARAAMGMLTVEAVATQAKAIRKAADKAGLGIAAVATGLLWSYPLTADDPKVRGKARKITEALLKAGALLGVDTALVIPGVVAAPFGPAVQPVPYDVVYARCREAVSALIPAAEKYGVKLGLEPVWNGFLLSPMGVGQLRGQLQEPVGERLLRRRKRAAHGVPGAVDQDPGQAHQPRPRQGLQGRRRQPGRVLRPAGWGRELAGGDGRRCGRSATTAGSPRRSCRRIRTRRSISCR